MSTVGVIGLGLMGSALAERFLAGGRHVIGFDLRDECHQRLRDLGGESVESADAVFEVAPVVVLSLPNSDTVEKICIAALHTRSIEIPAKQIERTDRLRIIDTTTGDPERTTSLRLRLSEAGIDYLDATFSGNC